MPDVSGPFDAAAFAQAPYYRDRGYVDPSGVQGLPATSAGAGDLGLTAAGFALTMALGRAHVRGAAYERTGTAWTNTVAANTSSAGPRNDLLVLRRDLTAKTVTPTYVQGTASATPTDPAIQAVEDGQWDLPLFRVQAPASSGTPLVITDLRRWIDPVTGSAVPLPVLIAPPSQWTNLYTGTTIAAGSFEKLHYVLNGAEVRLRGVLTNAVSITAATDAVLAAAGYLPAAITPRAQIMGFMVPVSGAVMSEKIVRADLRPDGSIVYSPAGSFAIGTAWIWEWRYSIGTVL